MIKKTRIKFVIVVEAIIALIVLIIGSSVAVSSYFNMKTQTINVLRHNLERLHDDRPNPPAKSREFFVVVLKDETLLDYDPRFYEEMSLKEIITTIVESNNFSGTIQKIAYIKEAREEKIFIVGIDISVEQKLLEQNLILLVGIGIPGLILLGVVMWFLSKWIIKPIAKNIEEQKAFVSDASHELKTPITAIMANMSVLIEEIGSNKWSKNVVDQTNRLALLTEELLTLSKLDEHKVIAKSKINLSELVNNLILSFESVGYEEKKTLEAIIPDDVFIIANLNELTKLLNIFLDNALVHGEPNQVIKANLITGNKPVLTVYNKTSVIMKDDRDKLFHRFYRADNSRSRASGGSGLGLAIAAQIAANNKWEINVNIVERESIEFIIKF